MVTIAVFRSVAAAILVGAAVLLGIPASAGASSGSLTNAFATPDWTKASFDVSVTGNPCLTGGCSWNPIVMAQPNLPSYNCAHQEWADSDPNTQEVWLGPNFTSNGSFSGSVSEAPILNRVVGQRLCLEIFGQTEHTSPVCEAQKKVFEEFTGKPQPPCPIESFIFSETLGTVLLTVEVPAPLVPPVAATPKVVTKHACPKTKKKVHRKGRTICVKNHHRRHHHRA